MRGLLILFITLAIFSSCELNQKDVLPTDNFVKIYNDSDESLSYYTESVLKLTDGYLILNAVKNTAESLSEYPTTTLIKTNGLGEIIQSTKLEWKAPVGKLVELDGGVGFVAMDDNEQAFYVEVNANSGEIESTTSLNVSMPLAATVLGSGNMVLLSYDYISWSSVVTLYSPGLNEINSEKLAVGEDLVVSVQKNLNKGGTAYPFFIGEWEEDGRSGFFVNCLYNYTLGVRFFASDGTNTGGWVYSHQIENATSSLVNINQSAYAMSRYFNTKNYINHGVIVDIGSLQNFNDSVRNPLPELVQDAKFSTIKAIFDGVEYIIYASTTNSNSILLYLYDLENDGPVKKVEVDFANKIEVSQIVQDSEDEGIVLLGNIYLTGRYLRPVLIKVPKREFI